MTKERSAQLTMVLSLVAAALSLPSARFGPARSYAG